MNTEKLMDLISKVEEDKQNIKKLIESKNNFSQEDWDFVTESYENIPELVANSCIIRKENLGKEVGINFIISLYNQDYPEDFYSQDYIKELLDMYEEDYNQIMGQYQSLLCYDKQWKNLFYAKQCSFGKKFIKTIIHQISMIQIS